MKAGKIERYKAGSKMGAEVRPRPNADDKNNVR